MQTPAAAIRQQVRILALEIGVRPAARKLGLNEDTVCSWAKREGWNVPTITQGGPPSVASTLQANTVGNAIVDELAENERETRLSLSRYAKRAAVDAEKASLRDAPYVKAAAQVAGIVHKWDANAKENSFTLNVLNINSLTVDQPPTLD